MTANRREALGVMAAAVLLAWRGGRAVATEGARAIADVPRVRPGAPLGLTCPGADAFGLEAPSLPCLVVPAPGGRADTRAPLVEADGPWATLRCVPLRGGVPCGAPAEVQVLTASVLFGA
jgi:hypothetical protein